MSPSSARAVTFKVNGGEVSAADHRLSGTDIKKLATAPSDARLYRDKGGSAPDPEIADTDIVEVHPNEEFYTVPRHIDAGLCR